MKDILIDFNVKFSLEKIWKWKFWILGACAIAGAISIYFSFKIPNEFKSSASFIPPAINSLTGMVFANGTSYRGFYTAGEEDIDRTVDHLNSRDITDSLARRFNLYAHYGINPDNPNRDKIFYHVYSTKNRISFSGRSLVSIDCYDVDPQMAFNMAGAYLHIAREWFEDLSQRREGLAAADKEVQSLKAERSAILDSMARLRSEHKIYHYDHVGEEISTILARQMQSDPSFSVNYDRIVSMELQLNALEERYGDLMREFQARRLNIEQFPELMWTTATPAPSTFKARPKRSIIVALTVIATALFSCFIVVVLDRRP